MDEQAYMCEGCGDRFTLPPAVRAKYPNWTPRRCNACRASAPKGRSGGFGGSGRGGTKGRGASGASATKVANLPLATILERYHGGPQTGVFTDGSCSGNPGPGGWGAVRVEAGSIIAERRGEDPATTNNRMELTAMIAGLEMVEPDETVDIYSDSQLVVNTLTSWAKGWEERGWKRREGEVKNLDLVQRAWALVQERPGARIQWIRAHDGSRWNEYADALSTAYLRTEV